jgi:hypothetical protein
MEYAQFEAALAEVHEIDERGRKAFRARLRVLRDMGVPAAARPGKGTRIQYDFSHFCEASLGLTLTEAGIPMSKAAAVMDGLREYYPNWIADISATEISGGEEVWLCVFPSDLYRDKPRLISMFFLGPKTDAMSFIEISLPGNERTALRGVLNASSLLRFCSEAFNRAV